MLFDGHRQNRVADCGGEKGLLGQFQICGRPGGGLERLEPQADAFDLDHLLPDQVGTTEKGGTMRLGSYPCSVRPGTILHRAYGKDAIDERHRHRYEFNNAYRDAMEQAGLTIAGTSPDGSIVEVVELSDKAFFVGVQFHPEFKSRPNRAHPLFLEFVKAAGDHVV